MDFADYLRMALAPIGTVTEESQQSDRYTVIALTTRPGIWRFLTLLEYEHFPPGEPINQEYTLHFVQWPNTPPTLMWAVLIVPLWAKGIVQHVAVETGMRIADGVPTLIDSTGPTWFPIGHARVFTLENDPSSPVYLPNGDQFIRDEERRWMEAFLGARGAPKSGL